MSEWMQDWSRAAATVAVAALFLPAPSAVGAAEAGADAAGARAGQADRGTGSAATATGKPDALRDVGIVEQLGLPLPAGLAFRDHEGTRFTLGRALGERPVLLGLVYYRCPMLCTLVLNDLVRALRTLSLTPGTDFELVLVSIDPAETPGIAAARREDFLRSYARPGAAPGVRFLTGDEDAIRALAGAVGFSFRKDPSTGQFAHPAALVVVTPEGRVSRYLHGINYAPRDLRLALVEASSGRIGTPTDHVLLYCFRYDPASGRYGLAVMRLVRGAGVVTVLLLALGIAVMVRRERRERDAHPGTATTMRA